MHLVVLYLFRISFITTVSVLEKVVSLTMKTSSSKLLYFAHFMWCVCRGVTGCLVQRIHMKFHDFSLKKAYRKEQKKFEESMLVITQLKLTLKEQTNILMGDSADKSEVLRQIRQLNQRLPMVIEQNQEISSDIKAIFADWGDSCKCFGHKAACFVGVGIEL